MYGLKRVIPVIAVAAAVVVGALPAFGQSVNPCTQTDKLSATMSGAQTFTSNTNGNANLTGTSYGYEMWTNGGNNNKLIWYGPNQGGGAAFRAEWNNPNDFLGRIGYYWGNGGKYTQYKNMYCDFNFTRSGRSTAGDYSYIGIYGWTKSPLVEYYIVEDWYGNQWQNDNTPITTSTTNGTVQDTFTVDGSVYQVVKNTRTNEPSIEGNSTTFTQYFSIRQTQRKCGSISITEHFKQWEKMGLTMGNMYEAKFLVEAGGGQGWFEATYLTFSQEDQPRNGSTPPGSTGKTLTVTVSPASGGKVTRNPDSASYSTNKSVALTATENPGYKFDGWSGDASGTTNPITVTMNTDKTITAKFSMIADDTTNLVKDGKFPGSSLTSNWTLNQGQYYDSSAASASVSNGKATINVTKIGKKGDPWNPQLVQTGIPLDTGLSYRLTFDAQASVARELQVLLQRPDSPWTTYSEKTVNLTTASQTVTLEFTMTSASNANGQLAFNLGQATGSVILSNVKLVRIVNLGNSTGLAPNRRATSAVSVKPSLRAVQSSSGVKVTFKSSESGIAALRLYNLKGDVLSSVNLQTVSGKSYAYALRPAAGKLPSGFYMVGLQHNGGAVERVAVLAR